MNMIQALRALGPIDVRSIRRDSALSWMVVLPIVSALILRVGVPALNASLLARYQFDLSPYYPIILAYFFVLMCPILFGVLVGFLLLDEKDDRTLTALQVTPLSLNSYIIYRISIPVLLTIVLMFVIFPLANLTPFDAKVILVSALAASPLAPMFALFMASQAQNKVQGFALMKFSGAVLLVPVFAYFVPAAWQLVFGLVPTYWPMKVYWMMQAGEPGVWRYLLIAILYQSAVTAIFVHRFNRALHR